MGAADDMGEFGLMDYQSVLTAVESWPAEERLRLIGAIWDRLSDEDDSGLSDETKAELERRAAALDANPDSAIPWEVVEARALQRFRK